MGEVTVEQERDFYRSLLALAQHDDPEPFLRAALNSLLALTRAQEGYIEIIDDREVNSERWCASEGCDAHRVDEIRGALSRGIIAEALASGQTVLTAAAALDPRFHELESVKEHRIAAVLCAPIRGESPLGVVYLQGKADAVGLFGQTERARLELFATSIVPFVERLLHLRRTQSAGTPPEDALRGIIVKSPAMQAVLERVRAAAKLDLTILLTGPTGTGKSLLARAIHHLSPRAMNAFMALNCAALPEALLENELFGAEEGGHSTTPKGGVRGKIEAAEGGTLLLDEIAELPLNAQAKLLDLLQSRRYFRLGGDQEQEADVRVIVGTNANLREAVAEKRFREDLYYRLRVLEIRVPALEERPEDIAPLAAHFCREACTRHGLPVRRLSPGAMMSLHAMDWPGNVRELAHRIEAAVVSAHIRGANLVELEDFAEAPAESEPPHMTLHEATRRFQKTYVSAVLQELDWNVAEAARRLDVARSHLYNLIRIYGMTRVPSTRQRPL